ncbi:MAG: sel1 repeat family protein [Planctomycetaceae bacterium]|nr:sel1 repeat family protein [Planctomycetaceae bacterium]
MQFLRINLLCPLLLALPLLGGCSNYKNQIGSDMRFEKIEQFRAAAEQGDAEAQFQLGCAYSRHYYYCKKTESSAPIDKAEGAKWFRKAAEQGHVPAQMALGHCYSFGDGVPKDEEEAVNWFREVAEQGHAEGMVALGVAYQYARGITENVEEAVYWYRKAAELGHQCGMLALGGCYFNGEGVPEDKTEAVKWFRLSAEQDNHFAQYELGKCYYNGEGVPQDKAEAIKWYRKADTWIEARFALIRCYLEDELVFDEAERQERLEGLRWIVQSAANYDSDSDWSMKMVTQAAELLREMDAIENRHPGASRDPDIACDAGSSGFRLSPE